MCLLHPTLVDTSVTWHDGTHSLGADLTQARCPARAGPGAAGQVPLLGQGQQPQDCGGNGPTRSGLEQKPLLARAFGANECHGAGLKLPITASL